MFCVLLLFFLFKPHFLVLTLFTLPGETLARFLYSSRRIKCLFYFWGVGVGLMLMQMRDKIRHFTTWGAVELRQSAPLRCASLHTLSEPPSARRSARRSCFLFSAPRTACAYVCVREPTHPDIKERLWCAALAISQPLVRVFSISARKDGQSTVISPMEMTSSRYRATSVLNSWTICNEHGST